MKEMVMSEETIFGICKRLGEEISKDLQNEEKLPIFVCVMKGAIQFMVDLMKHVPFLPSLITSSFQAMKEQVPPGMSNSSKTCLIL